MEEGGESWVGEGVGGGRVTLCERASVFVFGVVVFGPQPVSKLRGLQGQTCAINPHPRPSLQPWTRSSWGSFHSSSSGDRGRVLLSGLTGFQLDQTLLADGQGAGPRQHVRQRLHDALHHLPTRTASRQLISSHLISDANKQISRRYALLASKVPFVTSQSGRFPEPYFLF